MSCDFYPLALGRKKGLTRRRIHAILTVLEHLVQLEVPMFHPIILIPALGLLLLGVLLLAVLCKQ